jgi:hypothetical protein
MLCELKVHAEDDAEELHRLMAATLHLMTAYATRDRQACPLLAQVITRHLGEIARASESHAILRATSADLVERWQRCANVPADCPRKPWWLRVVGDAEESRALRTPASPSATAGNSASRRG